MAIKMALEVCKVIPELTSILDFNKPDMHYIKTFRVKEGDKFVSRGTNLYWPEPKNDKFDFHPQDTIYQGRREDLNGTHGEPQDKKFTKMWNHLASQVEGVKRAHESWKNSDH